MDAADTDNAHTADPAARSGDASALERVDPDLAEELGDVAAAVGGAEAATEGGADDTGRARGEGSGAEAEAEAAAAPAAPAVASSREDKVVVVLKAVGDAPLLKQAKFRVGRGERFAYVLEFLRRQTKRDALFLYLKQAFAPALDELVGALYDAFGEGGNLVVSYSSTPAWG